MDTLSTVTAGLGLGDQGVVDAFSGMPPRQMPIVESRPAPAIGEPMTTLDQSWLPDGVDHGPYAPLPEDRDLVNDSVGEILAGDTSAAAIAARGLAWQAHQLRASIDAAHLPAEGIKFRALRQGPVAWERKAMSLLTNPKDLAA